MKDSNIRWNVWWELKYIDSENVSMLAGFFSHALKPLKWVHYFIIVTCKFLSSKQIIYHL